MNNAAITPDSRYAMAQALGDRLLRLLKTHMLVPERVPAFNLIPLSDRVVAVLNPVLGDVPDATFNALRNNMQGRRVVKSHYQNGRAYTFLQISYWPTRGTGISNSLPSVPLDLDQQPSPYHLPIGMTPGGPLWLSLMDMDSVLIGGARRMGKTHELHAWIQAAQHGAGFEIYLWDGKGGVEFGRYQGHPYTHLVTSLSDSLAQIHQEVVHRQQIFTKVGVTNLPDYLGLPNQPEVLRPIVLFLDELADLPAPEADALAGLVRRAGAFGVHPVVGIQRPDSEVVKGQLRANLATRIALPVVSPEDSRIILQRNGADRLPKVKGRMLLVWEGRLIEVQGFTVRMPHVKQTNCPVLSKLEYAMARAAVERNGWFKIRDITEVLKERGVTVSRDTVEATAKRWEVLGFLTAIQTDEKGTRLGRRISPSLEQAYHAQTGLGGQADLPD